MSTSNSPTLTLLHSAFGPQSTLYTILQCTQSSTPTQLKRAYHKAALRYHPDRCCDEKEHPHHEASSSSSSSAVLKFQAVSAAYQLLMDDRRRSVYNATGQILEEDDDNDPSCNDDGNGESHAPFSSTSKARASHHPQGQWEQFFQSIFHELISTGAQHATTASAYRGSKGEQKDVLYYYRMCKGNMAKVVECIIHGSAEDVGRWKREIVDPAVERGEVDDYGGDCVGSGGGVHGKKKKSCDGHSSSRKQRRTILEDDSSSSDEEITKVKSSNQKRLRKRKSTNNSALVDTDEEEDDTESPQRQPSPSSSATTSMSKRDKMDHRVAKKRKAKVEKEMEMADIIQSKNWDINAVASHPRPPKNMGGISDALLSDMEQRYGNTKKKKKKREKR